jgi:hypothetical protein
MNEPLRGMLNQYWCLRCYMFLFAVKEYSAIPLCARCAADPNPPIHPWWFRTPDDRPVRHG